MSFKDQVLFFKSEKDIDKVEDGLAEPIGDRFLNKIKTMNEYCKEDMEEMIRDIRKYGHFSAQSGEFIFYYCKNCNKLLGEHEKEEDECKEDRIDNETVKKVEEKIRQNDLLLNTSQPRGCADWTDGR